MFVKVEVDEEKLKTADFVYETEESTDKDLMNEDEAFDALPLRKKRIYNEMVEFQTAMRQFGLAGSLHRIIHGQQENINPLYAGCSCPERNGYSHHSYQCNQ